jgi:Trp operon repressor
MANNIQKNSNVARVKAYKGGDFFYKWLNFIKPLHTLTNLEMKVLSLILAKRQELIMVVRDDKIINNLLRSSSIRKEIRDELNMTSTQFNILYGKLKKTGVINEYGLVNKYIPNVEYESNEYRLILTFDIIDKTNEPVES